VGSFRLPPSPTENKPSNVLASDSGGDTATAKSYKISFAPDRKALVSRNSGDLAEVLSFDLGNGSFSSVSVSSQPKEISLYDERIGLPNGGTVNLQLDRGEADLECRIRAFEHYSPDGELLTKDEDQCQQPNSNCDFDERLATALQLPVSLVKEHEWLSPWSPAYERSEMSFLRSYFKWNCKDVQTLVELATDPSISFVKEAAVDFTVRFPGAQLRPQRFVTFDPDANELLSWTISEGYPDSSPPPKPCIIDFDIFGARYLDLPVKLTPLNARFSGNGEGCVVFGQIKAKSEDGTRYLVIGVSTQGFSSFSGNRFELECAGEFSPYEKGYAQGDLDADQAVTQTRPLADGTSRKVEDTTDAIEKVSGIARPAHKRLSAARADAYWGFDSSGLRSSSLGDRDLMQLQSGEDIVHFVCPSQERFVDVSEYGDFSIMVTTRGAYSYRLSDKAISGFWRISDVAGAPRGSLAEYAVIDGLRGIVYLTVPDGSIEVLKVNDQGQFRHCATIRFTTKGEPVVMLPDNIYANLGRSTDGIHFSDRRQTFPFEQFDLRLNRPDIVLERLGAPTEAVAIAKQLREKRLKRMGVTEEMLKADFHVPELEIVGDVPATADANEINLAIKASDSKYPLERLKVYVNNVPVNGRDGESLRDQNTQSLERTIPIKLATGRNKIQVSVLNNAGAESLYANAEVNCTAKRPRPTIYAVALGVSDYGNPDWNLKYAAKDAKDVLAKLKVGSGDQYDEVKELLLTDKEVTKESIAKIKDFLSGATIDDTVLMFVAGHGLLDSNYDYYFGTTDIDFDNPADKGIAFEEFDDLLADLPSLKKSLLIDTCHAGELDEEEKTLLAAAGGISAALPTASGVAVRSIGTRGMNVKAVEGARGASEWYDRLQGLFVDLRRGSGSTILSSSAGAEYALESSEQQNGLFTYAVLEALDGNKDADINKDGSVQMSELGEYVKKRVSELTNNKQTPNTRRVNLEGDFSLAKTK
jgi:hypothetical protein